MLSSRPVEIGTNHLQYAKTPGRVKNRGENAVRPPMTGGKAVMRGKEAAMQTPHAAQLAGKLLSMTTRGKPLGDKTPFPNRVLNQNQNHETPGMGKISKPTFELVPTGKAEGQLRPSSLRKHGRSPIAGRNLGLNPLTPANKGNHWDCGEASFTMEESEVQEAELKEDYDEIEYMAPNTLDLPYQPPFDFELPDFRELGSSLFSLAHSRPYPDSPPPEIQIRAEDLPTSWDILELPPLESDDPFSVRDSSPPAAIPTKRSVTSTTRPLVTKTTSQKAATTSRPAAKAPTTTRATVRPALQAPSTRSAAPSRTATTSRTAGAAAAIPNRPATAASIRPPFTSRATAGAALRRPTTSAANYKPITLGLPSRRGGTAESKNGVVTGGARKAQAGSSRVGDGGAVVVNVGDLDFDDFKFDV